MSMQACRLLIIQSLANMSEGFLQYIRGCLDLYDPTVDAMQPLANNSSSCSDLASCFDLLGDKLPDGRRQDIQGQVICILACREGVKGIQF